MKHYFIYEEGFQTNGESCRAHFLGEADGEDFLGACKNYIKEHAYGGISVLKDGTEIPNEWGCRWFPTMEEARRTFG